MNPQTLSKPLLWQKHLFDVLCVVGFAALVNALKYCSYGKQPDTFWHSAAYVCFANAAGLLFVSHGERFLTQLKETGEVVLLLLKYAGIALLWLLSIVGATVLLIPLCVLGFEGLASGLAQYSAEQMALSWRRRKRP